MSAALGYAVEEAVEGPPATPRRGAAAAAGWLLPIWGWLVILWLSAPIIVMIVFGFNDGNGRQVSTTWKGFTFKWYAHLFDVGDLTTAIKNSITIAVLCTLISVVLGTLMGVSMGKFRFRGSGSVNLLMFANIAAPEVVLGVGAAEHVPGAEHPARLLDDPHRARHVQHRLRRGHGAGADGRPGPGARGSGRVISAPARSPPSSGSRCP